MQSCYEHASWVQPGPALPDSIISSLVLDDRLYVLRGQGITASNLTISYWDGTSWHDTLDVRTQTWPTRLGVLDGQLCLYGGANKVNESLPITYEMRIWNGSSWTSLPHPRIANFTGFTQFKGDIYAIGDFYIDDRVYNLVRCRNGVWKGIAKVLKVTTQDPLHDGSGKLHCLLATKDVLYMGGDFLSINGAVLGNVLQWDGESLQKVGNGVEGSVRSMDTLNGDLYVCGGLLVNARLNVAVRFDGTTWKGDTSFSMEQYWAPAHIKAYRQHVYIWNEDGINPTPAWRWDGKRSEKISKIQGYVGSLLVYRDELFAVGELRQTCDLSLRTFARLHLTGSSSVEEEYSRKNSARCYPNPAGNMFTVEFTVRERGPVRVAISDMRGSRVATLADGTMEKGPQMLQFNTGALPDGRYVVTITQESGTETQALSIIH